MKRIAIGVAVLCGFFASASIATARVSIHKHCDYQGYGVVIAPGSYDLGALQSMGVQNDDISSVRVPPGWKATLYEHAGYRGRSLTITSNDRCLLAANFNDITSAIRVEKLRPQTNTKPRPPANTISGTYRLTTQWQGMGRSLDIVNDDIDRTPILADTGNYSGQMWDIEPLSNGYYRLTTQWQGKGMSLDVINDGTNNRVQLAPTGNYSGQYWKLTPQPGGYYRLTTQWRGDTLSLDIINDGTNRTPILAPSGNYSGQLWRLTPIR